MRVETSKSTGLGECAWLREKHAPGGRTERGRFVWVHRALRILSPHNGLPAVRYHLRNKAILNRTA